MNQSHNKTASFNIKRSPISNSNREVGKNNIQINGLQILGGNASQYREDDLGTATEQYLDLIGKVADERVSGYPQPQLYDQYYINTYAYPKGLVSSRKEKHVKQKSSLYDIEPQSHRKGFSGWKLTMNKPPN